MVPIKFLLVALAITVSNLQYMNARLIRLNPKRGAKGVDNATCLEESSNIPCKSLGYVAKGLQTNCTNTTIQIEHTGMLLYSELIFKNCYNLSIISTSGKNTHIQCKGKLNESSGFRFENATKLRIKSLKIVSCKGRFRNFSSTAAFQVHNSTNITLENIQFIASRGTAIVFTNTFGLVLLSNIHFGYNKDDRKHKTSFSYPGGMHIEFTLTKTETMYRIEHCTFIGNKAPKNFSEYAQSKLLPDGDWGGQGLGGGLGIIFNGVSSRIKVLIIDCNFTNNTAKWGGGMYMHYQKKAINNTVVIENTLFENNTALSEGGAMNAGFLQVFQYRNKLNVTNCVFHNNTAYEAGGGTSLFAVHVQHKPYATVVFQNCIWSNNKARSSSAIDIAPSHFDCLGQGFLFAPIFKNCTYLENVLYNWKQSVDYPTAVLNNKTLTSTTQYSGVFTVTKGKVVFQGLTIFENNKYTALHVTSSMLVFNKGSKVRFYNNLGLNGAAIAMYGFSSLVFESNTSFNFTNNTATGVGGAIYYETFDQHDFTLARKCFLQYKGKHTINQRNVSFTFMQNTAQAGTAIYSSSFYPCFFEWFNKFSGQKVNQFFPSIASFYFNDNNSLATNGRSFKLLTDKMNRLAIIPAKAATIPLVFLDELGQAQQTAFKLSFAANSSLRLNPLYTVDTSVSFYGQQFENFTFFASSQQVRKVSAVIQMTLLPCPPGFYYDNKSMSCACAAERRDQNYIGLTRYNNTGFYAYIQYGFWGGYISDSFYTALCPLTFCTLTTNSYDPHHLYALPNSSKDLNNIMCGSSRKGILCSECQENKSVYYHSSHFECKENRLCKLGFLFYIVSEIFPTVILFTVIITFNISFTSGNINGFVLFSQVLDTITLNVRLSNDNIENTTQFFNMIYGLLNFRFFSIKTLSFCLWEGATVMDMLTFKYVTIFIAFLLVIVLIVLMNSNLCVKLHQKLKPKQSIIHGLSAFLVICYNECTKISFYILTRVVLQGAGGTSGPAVTFFGGILYFKGKHLIYAFPAVICLVLVTIIPPVLLFMYPLVYQLLSLCGLSEHYIVTKVSNVIAIHKLMPMFDSFQSCYKDKLRFFAGLYFMYRVAILAAYSISKSVTLFHIIVGFLLFVIMGIHSFLNPYKKTEHNRIDSLLFLNLAIINALTLLSIVYAIETKENPDYVNRNAVLTTISMVQMFLIGIPIFCFIFWMFFVLFKKIIENVKKKKNNSMMENSNLDDFPVMRDLDENDNDDEQQYFKLTDNVINPGQ